MKKFVKGNEAVMIGALYAGCDAYFGYPITPASEIAHAAAEMLPAMGKVFLQAECETASINMMYGGASAGKVCMTASSGPGMSLMQEGLSYMAGAQLPGVVVDVQRTGPGLGNIGPEQGDYDQAVKGGGHGNYKCIVLAPSSVQEMCDLTIDAFHLSFKYRNPAVVLADAVLGQMMEALELPDEIRKPEPTGLWAVRGDAETRGNLIASIYLQIDLQEEHNIMLQEKYASMVADARSESYLVEDAEIIITAFGSCARIALSAVDELRNEGIKAGLFRPITLFPFPKDDLREAVGDKDVLVAELSNGQYRDDVKLNLHCKEGRNIELINRLGGNIIRMEDIKSKVREMMGVNQ